MQYPSQTTRINNKKVTFIWIKTPNFGNYQPITQAYGVIINNKKEILVGRQGNSGSWNLPGGTVEKDETPLSTLKRELLEEVDVEVDSALELGVFKVFETESKNSVIYQVRYLVTKYKLKPPTADPATGMLWQRKFVPISEIVNFIDWGVTGKAMFADALGLFETTQ